MPGENSYLQRTLVMLRGKAQDSLNINKHLNLWNGFVSVLMSGFLTPTPLPYYACTRNFNFSILINLYLFFIISGLDYKVSPKKVCLGFLSTKIHCFVVKSTSRGTKPIDGGGEGSLMKHFSLKCRVKLQN